MDKKRHNLLTRKRNRERVDSKDIIQKINGQYEDLKTKIHK